MKILKLDKSILCFILVMMAAIPVAALRAKTYSVGYDLGRLKEKERDLRQRNIELRYELAETERMAREKNMVKKSGEVELHFPNPQFVLRGKATAIKHRE